LGGKRNRLSPNLNYTTNSQEKFDLNKTVFERAGIDFNNGVDIDSIQSQML
jgi:hypothetical protein